MKFIYEYRTKDNVRHSGVIDALDREAAFVALKKIGIRPGKMAEAPGFLNKLFSKTTIVFVGAVFISLIIVVPSAWVYLGKRQTIPRAYKWDDATRRQIIGDVAIVEKGIRTGWRDVFSGDGERFLASYAIPGVLGKGITVEESELQAAIYRKIEVAESDALEVVQIKSIVKGMQNEAREFLEKGGSVSQYCKLLVQRQRDEIGYYQRAKNEVDSAIKQEMPQRELEDLLDRRNESLRSMGIRCVTLSGE